MKLTRHLICLLAAVCMISCSKDNEPGDENPGNNNSKVTINADGSTSTGAVFSLIDGTTFYLDYIKYEIVDSHLEIIGYDSVELKGDIAPYAEVNYLGAVYKTRIICRYAFDRSEITSVIIPNTVTDIDHAFNNCNKLVSVIFPEKMNKIYGFKGCESLESIKFPKSVKRIWGFTSCSSLKSVDFPESVESIWGFDGCSLKSVDFPESVKEINGFSGCESLTVVNLPNSLYSIGGFNSDPVLESIYIPASVQKLRLENIWPPYEFMISAFGFAIPEIWLTNCKELRFDDSNDYDWVYYTFNGSILHVKQEEVEFCRNNLPYNNAYKIIGDYSDYKK